MNFFNSSNTLISSSPVFVGPVGQVTQQEYNFSSVIPNVSKIDLVVLSSNVGVFTRIEIREVAFTSTALSTAVPEPSTNLGLIGLALFGTASTALKRRKVTK